MRAWRMALIIVATASVCLGQIKDTTRYAGTEEQEKKFQDAFGTTSRREWTPDGGRLREFVGRSTSTSFITDPDKLLKALEPIIGVDPKDLWLKRRADTDKGAHFEFQQLAGGKPIENAILAFDLDRDGALIGLHSQTGPRTLVLVSAAISVERAKCIAASDLLSSDDGNCAAVPPDYPSGADAFTYETSLTSYLVDGRAKESHQVIVRSSSPRRSRRYVIDGETGKILDWRDRVYSFDGKVFNPDPLRRDASTTLDTVPEDAYEVHPLQGLATPTTGPFVLAGSHVKVVDFTPNLVFNDDVTSADGNFLFERGDVRLPSVMIYCHVDEIQRYVQNLGFTNIANGVIEADARDGISSNLNADFDEGKLNFGFAAVPPFFTAEDGEIVAHEYAHALQYAQAGDRFGTHDEGGAIREGFADYWALSYFERDSTPVPGRVCFADWLAKARSVPCERVIDVATIPEYDPALNDHANSVIWSTALWEIRQQLGREETDRLVLESHWTASPSPSLPTFYSEAVALVKADGTRSGFANVRTLCAILSKRGFIAELECLTIQTRVPAIPPG